MLLGDLLSSILGLVDTGEARYVSSTGEDVDSGEEHEPFRSIAKALEYAASLPVDQHLTIHLQGNPTLTESLALPSNVSIVGPGTIQAKDPGPAVKIVGTAAARLTAVALRNVDLLGKAPYVGFGGAVLIEQADGVTLEHCTLRDSHAGRGGGLAVVTSAGVTLDHCQFSGNRAEGAVPGVDIVPVGGLHFPVGDGHGGGAYLRDSDVTVQSCTFSGNRAIYAGGGLAVSNDARPAAVVDVIDCEITRNEVSHASLNVMGATWTLHAAAQDMGDPIRELFRDGAVPESKEEAILSNAHGMNYESGLGGGIALRNTPQGTTVRGCFIGVSRGGLPAPNVARRGGGIHLYIGAYPRLESNTIAYNGASGDGGGVCADYFDPFMPAAAPRFGIAAVPVVPRVAVVIADNTFLENQSVEDGGGVYFTGGGLPEVTGGLFKDNRAGEHGGGIRATYATRLTARSVVFERNKANAITVGPVEDNKEGGGAVSARNADVHLEDCTFVRNRVFNFAGGAIYFRSGFEGGADFDLLGDRWGLIADEHDLFDEIAETEFSYHTRTLRIVNCQADDNRALDARGAGAFLYALRAPTTDGAKIHGGREPMWVSVEGPRTDLRPCTSEYDRPGAVGTRKRGEVVLELSGRVTAAGVPEDRLSIGREVPAIATSVPAPSARAVLVMPDGEVAHDLSKTPFAGGPYVFGPVPTLTSIAPALARAAGGTRLQLTGTGFETGMRVRVGDRAAVTAVETATTVDVDLPALPAGTHDVVLSLLSGAQATLVPTVKIVPAPEIASLSPVQGRAGDVVSVRGTGLPIGTTVHLVFGAAAPVEAAVVQIVDDELSFTVPAPPPVFAAGVVRVTSPTGETADAATPFQYAP